MIPELGPVVTASPYTQAIISLGRQQCDFFLQVSLGLSVLNNRGRGKKESRQKQMERDKIFELNKGEKCGKALIIFLFRKQFKFFTLATGAV
jgi:hypothetical protein